MSSSEITAVKETVDTASAGAVRLDRVTHRYGRGGEAFTAVGPVDLTVPAGEFLVLVGASGCGKSTLLRLIAGFERPTQGSVRVSGAEPRPGDTAGVVFQTPRLFPWRTVRGNIDLALRYAGVDRAQWPERRAELLARVGLGAPRSGVSGRSPAVSSSVSPSPVLSQPRTRSSCSTNRSRRWTR